MNGLIVVLIGQVSYIVSADLLVIVFGIVLGSIIGRITTKIFAALDFESKKGKNARWRV